MKTYFASFLLGVMLILNMAACSASKAVRQYDTLSAGDFVRVDSPADDKFNSIGIVVSDGFGHDNFGNACSASVGFDPDNLNGFQTIALTDIAKIKTNKEFYKYLDLMFKHRKPLTDKDIKLMDGLTRRWKEYISEH